MNLYSDFKLTNFFALFGAFKNTVFFMKTKSKLML